MNIKEIIKRNKPSISNSSLRTYESILRNLYTKVFKSKDMTIENFNNDEKIFEFIKDIPPNKRKSILSALVVLTDNKVYREKMLDDIKEFNKENLKQEKTEYQKENWVETEELDKIYNELKKSAELIYKKKSYSPTDYQDIQNYIILSVLGGFYIPPRRSKDYVLMKITQPKKNETESDLNFNYYDKKNKKFIFNSYKTAKTYGQQIVVLPDELVKILNKWLKINPTEYLLFDTHNKPLTNVKLNQRLNKIFNKKASVNQMRHTYLTKKYGSLIKTKENLLNDMSLMGTSILQETTYIKK